MRGLHGNRARQPAGRPKPGRPNRAVVPTPMLSCVKSVALAPRPPKLKPVISAAPPPRRQARRTVAAEPASSAAAVELFPRLRTPPWDDGVETGWFGRSEDGGWSGTLTPPLDAARMAGTPLESRARVEQPVACPDDVEAWAEPQLEPEWEPEPESGRKPVSESGWKPDSEPTPCTASPVEDHATAVDTAAAGAAADPVQSRVRRSQSQRGARRRMGGRRAVRPAPAEPLVVVQAEHVQLPPIRRRRRRQPAAASPAIAPARLPTIGRGTWRTSRPGRARRRAAPQRAPSPPAQPRKHNFLRRKTAGCPPLHNPLPYRERCTTAHPCTSRSERRPHPPQPTAAASQRV
jgi:hypothetical protein